MSTPFGGYTHSLQASDFLQRLAAKPVKEAQ